MSTEEPKPFCFRPIKVDKETYTHIEKGDTVMFSNLVGDFVAKACEGLRAEMERQIIEEGANPLGLEISQVFRSMTMGEALMSAVPKVVRNHGYILKLRPPRRRRGKDRVMKKWRKRPENWVRVPVRGIYRASGCIVMDPQSYEEFKRLTTQRPFPIESLPADIARLLGPSPE